MRSTTATGCDSSTSGGSLLGHTSSRKLLQADAKTPSCFCLSSNSATPTALFAVHSSSESCAAAISIRIITRCFKSSTGSGFATSCNTSSKSISNSST